MEDNSQTGNEIANQWLKFWAESSTLAWKNWSILMGLNSTNGVIDSDDSSENLESHELTEEEAVVDSTEHLQQIELFKQKLSLKDSQFAALNNKIKTSEAQIAEKGKYYYCLEQEHRQQSEKIEELKAKIDELENKLLENQVKTEAPNNEDVSSDFLIQIKSLHEEVSAKEEQITQLKAKIRANEEKLEEKAKNYWLLAQENELKTQKIEQLQGKIANLESMAVIADRQLNKWRSRTFSS